MVDTGSKQFAGSRLVFIFAEKIQDAVKFLYFFFETADFNQYGLNLVQRLGVFTEGKISVP
jgi:hypothetical protein